MATYKVIQDIEAEDKLLGPLSMRQFIYAIIVVAFGALAFFAAKVQPLLVIPFLPPMGFFGLLAAPFGRDQSSEVWLLAKIRFMFKPRKRIWDQSGIKELVTITVPKKIEKHLTDGLDQTQVKSRLSALANTLDSRGWAIKNVVPGTFTPPVFATGQASGSDDRLLNVGASLPQTPAYDAQITDDILDEQNNPTARKLESLIEQSAQSRRQNLVASMQTAAAPLQQPVAQITTAPTAQNNPWFAQPAPQQTPTAAATTPAPPSADEEQLLEHLHQNKAAVAASNSHIKRIPTSDELVTQHAAEVAAQKAAADRDKELKRLAANDDLNVDTIARQAQKGSSNIQTMDDGEVVISLH